MSHENSTENLRIYDWVHFALGGIVAVSPWLKGFGGDGTARGFAIGLGAAIVALAVVTMMKATEWPVWGIAAMGVITIATAFLLKLPTPTLAFKTFVIAGALLIGSSLWKSWRIRNPEPDLAKARSGA